MIMEERGLLQTHISWILFYNFLIAAVGISAELYFSRSIQFRNYDRQETATSLLIFIIAIYATMFTNHLVDSYPRWLAEHALFHWHGLTLWNMAVGLVVGDFIYYWLHRYSHEVRLGWATHIVHHSPEKLNISAAYRIAATALFSFYWLAYPLMLLLGFSPTVLKVAVIAGMVYQFWIHTDVIPKLGWLEHIFNTPAHHRVHHATNPEYIDCNYGGILIVFDRIFGTYRVEIPDLEIKYGVTEKLESQNAIYLIFSGWIFLARDLKKYPGFRNAVLLIFRNPGWRPAETAKKADEMNVKKIG
jgi:sterol desaturase/sphingolipid hydroxylase (fatty acid hydroxylase superfamily)